MKRRQFVLLIGAGGVAASSVGTSAFSSAEAERDVSVDVKDDADAYLGITQTTKRVTVGESTEVVRLENKFPGNEPLSLSAIIDSTDDPIHADDIAGDNIGIGTESDDRDGTEIHPGETAHIDITCGGAGDGSFTLSIRGTLGGGEAVVDATREFSVTCESPGTTTTTPE